MAESKTQIRSGANLITMNKKQLKELRKSAHKIKESPRTHTRSFSAGTTFHLRCRHCDGVVVIDAAFTNCGVCNGCMSLYEVQINKHGMSFHVTYEDDAEVSLGTRIKNNIMFWKDCEHREIGMLVLYVIVVSALHISIHSCE